MRKLIPMWLFIVIMIELIGSAILFTLVRDATRVEPAVYFRQYDSHKEHYTVIKVELSKQDSLVMRHDTLYLYRNNSYCSICVSDVISGILIK